MRKLLAVLALSSMVFPAYAGGSMAPEVRVIIVKPSLTIQRIDEEIARQKRMKAAAKESAKLEQEERKFQQKLQLEADKAYNKKLEAQRKARK